MLWQTYFDRMFAKNNVLCGFSQMYTPVGLHIFTTVENIGVL